MQGLHRIAPERMNLGKYSAAQSREHLAHARYKEWVSKPQAVESLVADYERGGQEHPKHCDKHPGNTATPSLCRMAAAVTAFAADPLW
jgi:hypothetical protein